MRLMIAAAVAALTSLLLPGAVRAAGDADAPSTLSVTGYAEISRAPDLATVSVAIVTNDDNATRALSENNRRFAALAKGLTAAGIASGDTRSASIQSYFNPRPNGAEAGAPGQLYGFIVTRNVQIDVTALDRTGAVVDAATAAGATQIEGVSYGFRDRRAVERAALAAAVSDANAQAQTIAGAAHVQIVRILRIGDQSGSRPIGPLEAPLMKMEAAVRAPVPTNIVPSDLAVSGSVSITYQIR